MTPSRTMPLDQPEMRHSLDAGELLMGHDLAVHALAQLPERVTAEVATGDDQAGRALRMARAYGVDGRINMRPLPDAEHWLRFCVDGVERPYQTVSFASLLHGMAGTTRTATQRGDDHVLARARIAVITNQPAHYRIPLFNGVAQRLGAVDASLRVFFLQPTPAARPWLASSEPAAFQHEYLPTVALPTRRHRRPTIPRRMGGALAEFEPTTVLVAGLSPFVAGRALRFARRTGAATGVWCGEIRRSPTARGRFRRVMRRRILSGADFAIAYGWESARYLRQLAPSLPVAIGRNSSPLPERRTAPLAASSRPRFVAIGDLASNRKGMDVLVDALSLAPSLHCELHLIGGGELLPELESRARADPRIQVHGPLSAADTRTELSRSDIYLFPTRFDLFGLSLVEAMGCGIAVAVTRCAGAVEDLCVPDANCVLVDGHEPRDWANAIVRLGEDQDFRTSLGREAGDTVEARWTMDHAVDAMIAGLRLGVDRP